MRKVHRYKLALASQMDPPADPREPQAYPGTAARSTPARPCPPRRPLRTLIAPPLLIALCLVPAGCPPVPRGFGSPDPNMRIRAILAVEPGQNEHTLDLIGQLESLDPAARLLAAAKLRELTGESFGYDYAANEQDRRAAIDRWLDWADQRGLTADGSRPDPDHRGGDEPHD